MALLAETDVEWTNQNPDQLADQIAKGLASMLLPVPPTARPDWLPAWATEQFFKDNAAGFGKAVPPTIIDGLTINMPGAPAASAVVCLVVIPSLLTGREIRLLRFRCFRLLLGSVPSRPDKELISGAAVLLREVILSVSFRLVRSPSPLSLVSLLFALVPSPSSPPPLALPCKRRRNHLP